jgi:hypothetical protein
MLVELLIRLLQITYPVMVRVAFSPRVMPPSTERTPSSQPDIRNASASSIYCVHEDMKLVHTLDDLTNTNLGLEVTSADGGVEPGIAH